MHTRPITRTQVEQHHISDQATALFATVTRFGHKARTYQVSAASNARLLRATHGKYICRWPLGCGRVGWYANMSEYRPVVY